MAANFLALSHPMLRAAGNDDEEEEAAVVETQSPPVLPGALLWFAMPSQGVRGPAAAGCEKPQWRRTLRTCSDRELLQGVPAEFC